MNQTAKESENLEEFSEDEIYATTNDLLGDTMTIEDDSPIREEEYFDDKSQPIFHQENKTICQKLFPFLASSTDLNSQEIHTFNTIKQSYVISYD